jgi:hypothetical protein
MDDKIKELIILKKKVNQAHDLLVETLKYLREKELLGLVESETISKCFLSTDKLRMVIEREIGKLVSE